MYETKVLEAREIPESTRKHMPEGDFAGKGRSFPIETPEDVHAAAQSIGRAGADNHDADTLKSNIQRIAKRKGPEFEAKLPEAWKDAKVDACEVRMTDKGQRLAVRLNAVDGLVRVPLAKLGNFVKGAQKFAITRRTLSDIVSNFNKRKADTVIDYEHASEEPEVAQGGAVPAAGWIKAVEDAPDADGVLYGQAEFTPRAAKMIGDKEYRYMSPVIDWGARNKQTGEAQGATLTSAALTNRPFLDAMPAIAMSDAGGWKEIAHGDAGVIRKEQRAVKVIMTDRVARTVRVVNDDNTEQTLTVEGLEAAPRVIKLSDVTRNAEGVLDFNALQTGDGVLIAGEVFGAMTAQRELDAAVAEGKITPAQWPHFAKIAMSDLPTFREIVKGLPKQVDTTEHGIGGGEGAGGGAGVSELDKVEALIVSLADAKVKADPKLQYHDAVKLVASERPDLNKRRTQLQRPAVAGSR
jgi:phage I-like protein